MAMRYDIKITAEAFNSLGTIEWGPVSRVFSKEELQGVTLGDSLSNGKRQILSPRWPKNDRVWSVPSPDVVFVEVTPPSGGEGLAEFYISTSSIINLENEAGEPQGTYRVTERAKAVKQ